MAKAFVNASLYIYATAMSATKISSKIYEPTLYEKAISNPVHGRQWREAIEEELQNLEPHNTWEYDKLPSRRKTISSKWIFKIKYQPDRLVAKYKVRFITQNYP